MHYLDKLFLSGYLIKSSFEKQAFGAALMQGLRGAAKPLASRVLGSPALRSSPALRNSATATLQRAAPSVERQIGQGVPAIQRMQQRAAGSYAPRQPILSNVPDVVPAAAAAPALAAVAPAAAAAMPSGLALARQGFGQVGTGLNQALRSGLNTTRERIGAGLNTARERIGAGVSSVGRGISSAARNPLVQAGGVGLLGGAVGAYGMNRLMGGGAPSQQPNTAPSAGSPAAAPAAAPAASSGSSTPSMGSGGPGNYLAMAPIVPSVSASSTVASTPDYAALDEEGMQPAEPVVAPNNDKALMDAFGQYMGSYKADSSLDRAKLKYLKDLQSRNLELNASNIYNKSHGYGNWKY